MRVLDVTELGCGAAIVTVRQERVLLMDRELTQDDRVTVMLNAMTDLDDH